MRLIPGRLVRRYERFLADVELERDGARRRMLVRAHCVNPGRMEGMVLPGARVWLSESPNRARALRYTWELLELDGRLIGANTSLSNLLAKRMLEQGLISGFSGEVRPEQPLGRHHRVDFVLEGPRRHLVEVKNCHLVYGDGYGYFPDSHSERAVKHVDALVRRVGRGERASVVFTVQRADCVGLRPSALHAPDFAVALRRAARKGVELRAFRFEPTLDGLWLDGEVPVDVAPYDVEAVRVYSRAYDATSGWLRKDGRVAGMRAA